MCGIFGIYANPEAANLAYLGLHALQHRGQESAGIVTSDERRLSAHRGMGLVADVFNQGVLSRLPGRAAIGHVRYSTAGDSLLRDAQPLSIDYFRGALSVAHNGNLTNALSLRRSLEERGSIFLSGADTEVLVHLVARSQSPTLAGRVTEALAEVEGSYSLLFLSERELIAVRDPRGWRPLLMGRLGESVVFASESCAFDLIGAELVRDLAPGEMVIVSPEGVVSQRLPEAPAARTFCLFEHVYFARPDSVLEGRSVYEARKAMGLRLARECPAEVDVVIPVPDSGVAAAMGFAAGVGAPYELGLIRNHYVGRTFIEPKQAIRHFGVRLKLNAQRAVLEGRRVAVIDDSIVRGTTSKKIIAMIRAAGAREIHLRIASPPVAWPCYYGIDTPTRGELIAAQREVEGIREFIGADSVGYLSLAGLKAAIGGGGFCDACFTGQYPVPPKDGAAAGKGCG
jgi:amidophosphoribosyltransferase